MARARSPFTLTKREGGYLARFWSEADHAYTVAKQTGATNKAQAGRIAAKMLETGEVIVRSFDSTLADFLTEYWSKPDREVSAYYLRENRRFVERISEWPEASSIRLSKLDRAALYRLRDWLAEQTTPRMTNRMMQTVKVAISSAYERGRIPVDHARGVRKVDEKATRRGALTVAEVRKLIDWTGETRIHAALLLATLAGLRRGELRALRWQAVDFDAELLHVEESYHDVNGITAPKANSRRKVMLHPALGAVLETLREESPYTDGDDFVLPQVERGRPIGDVTLKRGFAKALDAIGVDAAARKDRKITLHALRHTFVTHQRQVLPDFVVQAESGHTGQRMQEVYSDRRIVDFGQYREALKGLYAAPKRKGKRRAR